MIRLDDAIALPAAGAKAQTLARARAAGLPVPDGIVLLPDEEIDEKAIAAELLRLAPPGARFAVRSSADVEDRPGLSAAGVFDSVLDVAAAGVPAAIERVRASAHREAARAYLGSRGLTAKVATLVQPMVAASALGVLHTAPLTDGKMAAEERPPDEPEWGRVTPRAVDPGEPLARGAARLAALLGGDADVEYAVSEQGTTFLQARPLTAAPARDPAAWDPRAAGRYRREAEHNPDPLSNAQASLVALVADLPGVARRRILHGYLFCRIDQQNQSVARAIPPQDLPQVFASEILPACDALLAPLEQGDPDPAALPAALDAYRAVIGRYLGEVTPALSLARERRDRFLTANLGEPLAAHGALLAGTGEPTVARDAALWRLGRAGHVDPADRPSLIGGYEARFGAFAPAWDVCVPTDGELPTRVLAMASLVGRGPSPEVRHHEALAAADAAALELLGRLDRAARPEFRELLPLVRAALPVAEADDALFFRAQRAVRRALLGVGLARVQAGQLEDPSLVFELPIPDVARGEVDPARAAAARALRFSQRKLSPPWEIEEGRPRWQGGGAGGVLRGAGTSGRGWGRAFRLLDPAGAPPSLPPGAVLVTPTILPSLAWLLPGAAALVTDFGGALSHGATLAREYGVPAVLGTGRATATLADGEDLLVDADAGRVYRIG
jgi:rifampicin phosphotransferase